MVNQSQGTKWEMHYIDKYIEIFDRFQHTSKLMGATDSLFIELDHYRIIRKGTFLEWPLRENFIKTSQAMADAIHAVEVV